jgi:hypothetical protein
MQLKETILFAAILAGMAFSGMAQNEPTGASTTTGPNNLTANTGETGNVSVAAGRVLSVDVSTDSLTDKWAGFFGTVSGNTVLGDGANNLYQWTANNFANSKVVVTPRGEPVPGSVSTVNNPNTFLDNFYGAGEFSTGAANASGTFNLSRTADPLGGGTISTAAVETFNSSGIRDDRFTTFLYDNDDVGSDSPVYVANATSQTSDSFNSDSVNYQMLVGVGESASSQTFSFYLELP